MPISLDDGGRGPGLPVLKRTALGQIFVGALVKTEQRDVIKDGAPKLKDNGRPQQELVLTLLTMPGTTSPAGIGDSQGIPAPGDLVRMILRGASFGQWIEAKKTHGQLAVGDIVGHVTEYGQAYDSDGKPTGGKLTTQAEVDAVPRQRTLGIYGTLTLTKPTPAQLATVVLEAEAAYGSLQQRTALAPVGSAHDQESDF
jgi:hypothetical protein